MKNTIKGEKKEKLTDDNSILRRNKKKIVMDGDKEARDYFICQTSLSTSNEENGE